MEIIQLITKFGHGMSYSQVEKNETAICLQKLAASSAKSVPLPESIQPCFHYSAVYDNINFIEETLTGGVTSHRVNIITQPLAYGPHRKKPKLPSAEKQKQRSIPPAEFGLPVYKTGQKSEPGVVREQ